MPEAFYQPGTIVQLRSGGPHLTVTRTVGLVDVHVTYHNAISGKFEEFSVPAECLRAASAAPQVPQDAFGLRNTTVAKSSMS